MDARIDAEAEGAAERVEVGSGGEGDELSDDDAVREAVSEPAEAIEGQANERGVKGWGGKEITWSH